MLRQEGDGVHEAVVLGRRVKLELDVEERDRYGRLLAYVRRATTARSSTPRSSSAGYAQVLTVPPNVRYADRFLAPAAARPRTRHRAVGRF